MKITIELSVSEEATWAKAIIDAIATHRAAIERERRRLLSDVRAERDGAIEWRLGSGLVLEIPSAWWRSPRDKKGRCC